MESDRKIVSWRVRDPASRVAALVTTHASAADLQADRGSAEWTGDTSSKTDGGGCHRGACLDVEDERGVLLETEATIEAEGANVRTAASMHRGSGLTSFPRRLGSSPWPPIPNPNPQ